MSSQDVDRIADRRTRSAQVGIVPLSRKSLVSIAGERPPGSGWGRPATHEDMSGRPIRRWTALMLYWFRGVSRPWRGLTLGSQGHLITRIPVRQAAKSSDALTCSRCVPESPWPQMHLTVSAKRNGSCDNRSRHLSDLRAARVVRG